MRELSVQEMNYVNGAGVVQDKLTDAFTNFGQTAGKLIGGSLSAMLLGTLGTAVPVLGNLLGSLLGKTVGENIGGGIGSEAGNVFGFNFGAFVEGLFSGVSRFLEANK